MKPATRADGADEIVHGTRIPDPYRWLEDDSSDEVRAWIDAQNAHTRRILDSVPGREWIRHRLEMYMSVGAIQTPSVHRGLIFYLKHEGMANQPILYVREGADGKDRVLIDPNPLAPDGTVAIDWYYPSWDGRLVAYGTSARGDELSTLRIRDVATGVDLPDVIPDTRAASIAWEPSGAGFYYTRYPSRGSVPRGQEMYCRRIRHHAIGDDPSEDLLVFGEGREPDAWPVVSISPDGRWLVVAEYRGWTRTEVFLKDLEEGSGFVPVVAGIDALYSVKPLDDRLVIHTNEGASSYRVLTADPENPSRSQWKQIIPPARDALEAVGVVGGRIIGEYLKDAASRLHVFSMDGAPEGEIALPMLGSVSGFGGEWDRGDLYIGFSSFIVPPRVYRSDVARRSLDLWQAVPAPVDPVDYEVRQVRCTSKDGMPIPMFIVHRKDAPKDGSSPAILTGYGGFNVSVKPSFLRDSFPWLERGGIVAIANLRGGGEYGEAWHRAGMLDKKQNVFDDFIAAAEYLVRERFTGSDRLGISGVSNGGLLVGAALVQRPGLFRAAVCEVPLLDMIRYHRFRIARLWIPEYGSAEDPAQFEYLYAYSPYHHVKNGTTYPAVLLAAAVSDSRVDPMHACKMAARLQAAQAAADRPILLRLESGAGHGVGKPLGKRVDEQTDVWTFFFSQLGVSAAG